MQQNKIKWNTRFRYRVFKTTTIFENNEVFGDFYTSLITQQAFYNIHHVGERAGGGGGALYVKGIV